MNLTNWRTMIFQLTNDERVVGFLRALIILGAGLVLIRLVSLALRRLYQEPSDPHRAMLVQRGVYYVLLLLFAISAMRELGFDLSVLLGAAGILTVAIGFASQTSMANLISGMFLIGERPFAVGDLIQIGTTVGEVLSIDLLSVKLRQFDNTYVRIPNESIIKSEVSTLTRFPIRRIDLKIGVALKEDLTKVQSVLFEVADRNPLCLEEPRPLFIFRGFGVSSIDIQFSVWVKREAYLNLSNSIQMEIKLAFDKAGIEIPYPHRTLYAGSATEPFPVRVVPGVEDEGGTGGG